MKNIILTFTLLVFFGTIAEAQFQAGEKFISGSFYNGLTNVKEKKEEAALNNYSHNIGVSFGKFVQNNRAVGWGISHTLSTYKNRELDFVRKPLSEFGIGIERFAEYYKPLNDKFALYVRPSGNLGYTLKNTYQLSNDELYYETKTNSIVLGLSLGAGISWRISPKWMIDGGFAFTNPINISYGFESIEYHQQQNPAGGNLETKGTAFKYMFSPTLSSGSIGLGFRYFCGMK
ncbi:hypothetical protein [Dyadobacter sp. CY323]|uniref:hypothetical protein n=1 Tax=Dyadobacter sp. CY323 TaxID=2907302 RepID=UPI001F329381|nr:hypothetical protein [Dyadobacter sp. CY323]MCE6992386.1 hypothetical protein [Dyadobacter sp. CY323]